MKLRPRRRTIYLANNPTALTVPPPLLPPGATPLKPEGKPAGMVPLPPSAFQTTVAASGSIGLIGLTFSLSLGLSLELVPLAASLPWFVYATGKSVYLVVLLVSDVAALFGDDESPHILPTIRED